MGKEPWFRSHYFNSLKFFLKEFKELKNLRDISSAWIHRDSIIFLAGKTSCKWYEPVSAILKIFVEEFDKTSQLCSYLLANDYVT